MNYCNLKNILWLFFSFSLSTRNQEGLYKLNIEEIPNNFVIVAYVSSLRLHKRQQTAFSWRKI